MIFSVWLDGSGILEPKGNGVPSLGSSAGHSATLVIDLPGKSLYATDAMTGAISVFSIGQDKLKFAKLPAPPSTPSVAIDVAAVHASSKPLLAEPLQSSDTLRLLSIDRFGDLTPSIAPGDKIGIPTAVAADESEVHLYTTKQGDGTISTFAIGACTRSRALCLEHAVTSEDPPNNQSGQSWIVLTH